MAAYLKIHSSTDALDVSSYLHLPSDGGLEPSDPDMIDGQFGEAAGEGAPLIALTTGNAELAFPVYLEATTKPALHELVIRLNKLMADCSRIEWRDDGSTDISYRDVLFARFEPDYDYFRARQRWLAGTLRFTCTPYAHTGTSRLVASGGASAPLTLSIPTLTGDAPAQLDVEVRVASRAAGAHGAKHVAGFAVLPASYIAWWPAASMLSTDGVLTGGSGAAGSQYLRDSSTLAEVDVRIPVGIASAYFGRQRVWLLARGNAPGGATGVQTLAYFDAEGRSVVYAASSWCVVDMGVRNVDPELTPSISLAYYALKVGSYTNPTPLTWDVAGMLIMPEDDLMVVVDEAATGSPTYTFKETVGQVYRDDPTWAPARQGKANYRRGAFPGAIPDRAQRVVGFYFPDDSSDGTNGAAHNVSFDLRVSVRERFTYARP